MVKLLFRKYSGQRLPGAVLQRRAGPAGREFLHRVLGLEPIYDVGWAAVYGTTEKTFLGIVDRRGQPHALQRGLHISPTPDELTWWHSRICKHLKFSPIREVSGGDLRSLCTGPEGYLFEIRLFINPPLFH